MPVSAAGPRPKRDAGPSRTVAWLPALLLLLITATAYFPAMKGGFIWDDNLYAGSPVLDEPDCLLKMWTFQYPEKLCYREFPVVYTTLWLERRLWGLWPPGYHLDNIAIHIINAVLAWLLMKRMRLRGAWIAAAIFALHPVHVESVAWISERKNVLSGMFYLLALGVYMRFEDDRGPGWYLGSLVFFAAALLSKPVACTLPVILLLLRWGRGFKIRLFDLAYTLPFFIMSAAMGLFTMSVETHAWDPEINLPPLQRVLQASRALWFYPIKLVWPVNLTFSYERWALDAGNISQWLWVIATLGAGALIWRCRRRLGRGFIAGIGFYIVNISLVLGFVSIYTFRYSFVADHYQYLASLGLIVAGVGSISRLSGLRDAPAAAGPSGERRLGVFLGAAVLVLLGIGTWRQAGIYGNSDRVWIDTIKKNPSSWLAYDNLALSLAGQGKLDEAVAHYRAAIVIKADNEKLHHSLGIALAGLGRTDEAAAHYREALRIAPYYAEAHHSLGFALAELGRTDEAVAHYRAALLLNPGLAETHNNLGLALSGQGKTAEAIEHYRAALRLNPGFAKAQNNWGMTLANSGRLEEAVPHFREALKIDPAYSTAQNNFNTALAAKKGE